MPTQDRNTLKNYFNSGDKPTEQQFSDLIDSIVNIAEDKTDLNAAIDVDNDASFVTPKSAKKLIDTYTVRKVNNTDPDENGNVQVTDIAGTAGSITGNIALNQVTDLQSGLDAKLNTSDIKTVNGQTLVGSGNVEVTDITGTAGSITGNIALNQVTDLQSGLDAKLNTSDIKTINGQTLVGTGNIEITAGTGAPGRLIAIPSSPYTIPGTTSPNAFPANCDTFTLQANMTYFFKGKYLIANGTSHTISIGWTTTGLGITSMEYVARLFSSNLNAYATALSQTQVSGIALKVLNSSTASPTTTVEFEGVLRCTTEGTITPLIAFSTPASTPLSTMKVGSFIEFTEVGNNNVQNVGEVN